MLWTQRGRLVEGALRPVSQTNTNLGAKWNIEDIRYGIAYHSDYQGKNLQRNAVVKLIDKAFPPWVVVGEEYVQDYFFDQGEIQHAGLEFERDLSSDYLLQSAGGLEFEMCIHHRTNNVQGELQWLG